MNLKGQKSVLYVILWRRALMHRVQTSWTSKIILVYSYTFKVPNSKFLNPIANFNITNLPTAVTQDALVLSRDHLS